MKTGADCAKRKKNQGLECEMVDETPRDEERSVLVRIRYLALRRANVRQETKDVSIQTTCLEPEGKVGDEDQNRETNVMFCGNDGHQQLLSAIGLRISDEKISRLIPDLFKGATESRSYKRHQSRGDYLHI